MVNQYKIKINDIFLTASQADGSANERYLVEVDTNELEYEFLENVRPDMYGNPFSEMTEVQQQGKRVNFTLPGMLFAHYSDLIDIKKAYQASGTPVRLILTHPYNSDFDYDLQAKFVRLTKKEMFKTTWRNVEFGFITTGVTTP